MYCSRCGTEVDEKAKFCPSCGLDLTATTAGARMLAEKSEASEIDAVRDALKDEWEIEQELGRGGMAIVFKARDKQLERDVAIKVLPFSLAFDREFVERFQREARTAARLEHPHIIPIYRVGKSGRVIYFVMKFLRGGSLSGRIEEGGRLAVADIRRMLTETVGALGYAHKHGIVHRDIKPDNIMFDEIGHAVVTDFGIAKAATGTRLTGTGMSIGTPHYMSPEQARAGKLDGRSDIYSLGVVAYQCLAGHVPFDGEDAFSIGYKHIMEEVPTPELRSGEERQLFAIIRRMMAKAPEERFQTGEELGATLQGRAPVPTATVDVAAADAPTAIIHTPPRLRSSTPAGARPSTPTTPIPKAPHARAAKSERKRGGVLVGLLLVLFLGVGGAGGYWYFALDHRWPPTLSGGPAVTGPGSQPSGPQTVPPIALGDSGMATDSARLVAADTGATAVPGDTSPAPPVPQPTTSTLLLRGVPRIAVVTVDGDTVHGDSLIVEPRTHRIEVRRDGYEPFVKVRSPKPGDIDTITVVLKRREPVVQAPPPEPKTVCDNPVDENFNRDGSCFDVPPKVGGLCLVDAPAGTAPGTPQTLAVEVLASGEHGQIRGVGRGSSILLAAMNFARTARYTPAQKDGHAVGAWLKLPCRAR